MKNIKYKIVRFFDLYVGWLFINGMRQEDYARKMEEKYPDIKP